MAKAELTLRAGSSTGVQFRLMEGISGVNLADRGTVELWLRDVAGGTVGFSTEGTKLSINGTAGGSVLWTPGTGDLVAGSAPYKAYFKAYASSSAWEFYPEDSELTINVREAF